MNASTENSGIAANDHFVDVTDMIEVGKGGLCKMPMKYSTMEPSKAETYCCSPYPPYRTSISILMATRYRKQAKNFFSLGMGSLCAIPAPMGAVNMLTATMPTRAGR